MDIVGLFAWWKNNEERYLRFVRVVKRLFCIFVIFIFVERIFFKVGFIVNKLRSCFLFKNVDMLVFLVYNIKKVD